VIIPFKETANYDLIQGSLLFKIEMIYLKQSHSIKFQISALGSIDSTNETMRSYLVTI
jgi:uncharacterized membrane protein (UPF0127 family)